jgi:SPP1 gp7 family putative phage head morphogenesis protein
MTIDDSSWSLVRQMREHLARIHDAQTRTMAAAWANAWDDVQADLSEALLQLQVQAGDGKITRAAVLKSQRLLNALDQIDGKLNALFEQSGQLAIADLHTIVDNAGHVQERIISAQLPSSERHIVNAWSKVDPHQVDAIIRRSTEQITKLSYPLADQATATMKRELVRGLIGGSNPREVARQMVNRTEGIFNGGLSRALTIARTEQLDAHRSAAMLAEKANTDIVTGWIWAATLGSRTCPACWAMNGQEFGPEESGPDGHQNCRCVRVPQTKTWKQLGFDIPEPPSLLPDAGSQFDALSRSDQLTVLGPSRFAAWDAGKFPMSQWATTRHADGWRDSIVPAPAPKAFKGARRAAVDDTTKPWQFGRNAKKLGGVPQATLKAIQAVHDVPLLKNPLTVGPVTKMRPGLQGQFFPTLMRLEINPNAIGKGLTTAHEFGHYLDWQMFGNGNGYATASAATPEWHALRTAFAQSPEFKALRALAADPAASAALIGHIDYLTSDVEMFGRAYAQWITLKTGRRGLVKDLERMRKLPGPDSYRQWDDRNFGPIADALDALFAGTLKP